MRRGIVGMALGLWLGLALLQGATTRPNFLILIGEGQGWASLSLPMDDRDERSAGRLVRTPNLDRIGREGMRFPEFRAASPRCTPSRVALLTGRSPAALGMTFVREGHGDEGSRAGTRLIPPRTTTELATSETTVAELLKEAGYATAHFGKWHLGRMDPSRHGFDESTGPTSNGGPENSQHPNPKQAYAMADRGVEFIRKSVAAGKPFYLQVAQYAGRTVLDARPETVAAIEARMGSRDRVNLGSIAVAEDADLTYGQLLATLEQVGVLENTFVVYTTDHGAPGRNPPLSGGKGTVGDGGLRVPLLVRGPGIRAGSVARQRVSAVDLLPTIAEFAGVSVQGVAGLEGGSLVGILRNGGAGEVRRPREEWVVHFPHYDKDPQGPASAIYLGDHKLVRLFETDQRRLYDLRADPGENHDLAGQMPARVAEMDRRLSEYLVWARAGMPSLNPDPDPAQAASNLPGERRGKRGGRKGGAQ
jgi:arylsulfatase A